MIDIYEKYQVEMDDFKTFKRYQRIKMLKDAAGIVAKKDDCWLQKNNFKYKGKLIVAVSSKCFVHEFLTGEKYVCKRKCSCGNFNCMRPSHIVLYKKVKPKAIKVVEKAPEIKPVEVVLVAREAAIEALDTSRRELREKIVKVIMHKLTGGKTLLELIEVAKKSK